MGSVEISRRFYSRLGAQRLAQRTREDWDRQIVSAVTELLPRSAHVLDVGCGYGRIALPLARDGHRVHGLDVSADLIHAAREAAATEIVSMYLTIGSMTDMPFASSSFDAAICLWSAFHELLEVEEQVRAVKEMWRVIGSTAFVLIEGPVFAEATHDELVSGKRRGPDHRIDWGHVEGILNPHFMHDEVSFRRICHAAQVGTPHVFEQDWAGRHRQFLRIDKP